MKFKEKLVKGYKKVYYGQLVEIIGRMRKRYKGDLRFSFVVEMFEKDFGIMIDKRYLWMKICNKGWGKEVYEMKKDEEGHEWMRSVCYVWCER